MSEGNGRCDRLMRPLAFLPADVKLPTEVYNVIYETVDEVSDYRAERLVRTLLRWLEGKAA